jgi:hypothetical protein
MERWRAVPRVCGLSSLVDLERFGSVSDAVFPRFVRADGPWPISRAGRSDPVSAGLMALQLALKISKFFRNSGAQAAPTVRVAQDRLSMSQIATKLTGAGESWDP